MLGQLDIDILQTALGMPPPTDGCEFLRLNSYRLEQSKNKKRVNQFADDIAEQRLHEKMQDT